LYFAGFTALILETKEKAMLFAGMCHFWKKAFLVLNDMLLVIDYVLFRGVLFTGFIVKQHKEKFCYLYDGHHAVSAVQAQVKDTACLEVQRA
jgi:hypothetical protein